VQQPGWKVLDLSVEKKTKRGPGSGEEERGEQALPPGLAKGQPQEVIDVKALKKKTRPPKRYTEGTLLTAMETAGKTLDERGTGGSHEGNRVWERPRLARPSSRFCSSGTTSCGRARAWKPPTKASG
jgi:hypothetical protein